ncbi:S8 family peptidase [Patescibacteria group bacterium]
MRKFVFLFIITIFLSTNISLAAELMPDDTFYTKQWYLQSLNMDEVWAQETGDNNIIIAVIDSGVDISHPDLHDNIWVNQKEILGDKIDNDRNGYIDDINGWDFITHSNDPSPKYPNDCLLKKTCIQEAILHGTFVAGIAAAVSNNNLGVTGISWKTKVMPLRVLNEKGAGNTHEVIKAINYAIDNGADIINLSFVGDTYDKELERAIQVAYDQGIVIVAAAGNEDLQGKPVDLDIMKRYPVCHLAEDGEQIIIGVASVDKTYKLSQFSNYGSSCVSISAPGEEFWGILVYNSQVEDFNSYYGGDFSGTSLAAPIISGLVALIKSFQPDLTNQEIKDLLMNNTDDIDVYNPDYSGQLGAGLVNPVKVFQSLNPVVVEGKLIKGASSKTVYYLGANNKRYVFPDQATYLSWYEDYSYVEEVSDAELADIAIGGLITIKPGVRMVKITTLANVYAVDKNGVLRWVKTESLAQQLYGTDWAKQVVDISDAFFINYQVGDAISAVADFDPNDLQNKVKTIDQDKSLL